MPSNPQHSEAKLHGVVFRRKLKAFVVSALGTFALMIVFWSMSVRGFVSESTVQLKISDVQNFTMEDCHQAINQFCSQQVSDLELGQKLDVLKNQVDVEDPVMVSRNFDRIREAFEFEVVEDNMNEVALKVRYVGEGSNVEKRFVDQLAEGIAVKFSEVRGLGIVGLRLNSRVKKESLDSSESEQLDRIVWLTEQMQVDIEQIKEQVDVLKEAQGQSFAALPTSRNESPFRNASHIRENAYYQILKQKLQALTQEKSSLPSIADAEEFTAIEEQIAEVKLQLEDYDSNSTVYRPASFVRKETTMVEQVRSSLDAIDMEALQSSLAEIKNIHSAQRQNEIEVANVMTSSIASPPVMVKSIEPACLIPVDRLNTQIILSTLLMSLMFGSVIAWGYRPLAEDRGFQNARDLEKRLKIPVVTQLVRRAEGESEDDVPLCNLVVQLARYTLLAILLVVACSLLFSSNLRETFASDPFTGLSRIMWTVLGK